MGIKSTIYETLRSGCFICFGPLGEYNLDLDRKEVIDHMKSFDEEIRLAYNPVR